eukprot:7717617-Pyramimonas_sp.AAC.1
MWRPRASHSVAEFPDHLALLQYHDQRFIAIFRPLGALTAPRDRQETTQDEKKRPGNGVQTSRGRRCETAHDVGGL